MVIITKNCLKKDYVTTWQWPGILKEHLSPSSSSLSPFSLLACALSAKRGKEKQKHWEFVHIEMRISKLLFFPCEQIPLARISSTCLGLLVWRHKQAILKGDFKHERDRGVYSGCESHLPRSSPLLQLVEIMLLCLWAGRLYTEGTGPAHEQYPVGYLMTHLTIQSTTHTTTRCPRSERKSRNHSFNLPRIP